jgi:hypothetical protein
MRKKERDMDARLVVPGLTLRNTPTLRGRNDVDVGLIKAFADHLAFIHNDATNRASSRRGITFLRLPERA